MNKVFKLISIELYNIFNYRGKHFIDFHTEKDGNVFLFDIKNGGGKTSLFLSIKWGFYGFDNGVSYEKDGLKLTSTDFMNQDEHDVGRFYVRIKFMYDGSEFLLQRTCDDYTKQSTTIAVSIDGKMLHGKEAQQRIESIIPPDYGDFFMFNGEILSEIANKQSNSTWTNAVVHLLGLRKLDELRGTVKSIYDKMSDGYYKSVSNSGGSSELEQQISDKRAVVKKLEEVIPSEKAELDEIKEKIRALEDKRSSFANVENMLIRIRTLNAEHSSIQGSIDGCRKKLDDCKDKTFLVFIHEDIKGMLERTRSELKTTQTALDAPRAVASQYNDIQQSIVAKHLLECPVCRSVLSESQLSILKASLKSVSEGTNKEISALRSKKQMLKGRESILKSALDLEPAEMPRLCAELIDLNTKLAANESDIDSANDIVSTSEVDEIAKITNELTELRKKLPQKEGLVKKNELALDAKKKAIEKLEGNLSRIKIQNTKQQMERDRMLYTSSMDAMLNTIIERTKKQKRASILSKATEIFMSITNKPDVYKGLAYDDGKSFAMHIVRRDGERVYHPSSGEKHVLAISFLVSLSLNSDRLTPMMMDTPLSRLDPEHKKNIAATLAGLDNQVLFLAQPGELDDNTRKTFLPSVAKMYESRPNIDNVASIVEVER